MHILANLSTGTGDNILCDWRQRRIPPEFELMQGVSRMRILHAAFTSGLRNNYDYFIIIAHLGADYVGSLLNHALCSTVCTVHWGRSI